MVDDLYKIYYHNSIYMHAIFDKTNTIQFMKDENTRRKTHKVSPYANVQILVKARFETHVTKSDNVWCRPKMKNQLYYMHKHEYKFARIVAPSLELKDFI